MDAVLIIVLMAICGPYLLWQFFVGDVAGDDWDG